jgi:hypothetical protein
LAAWAGRVLSLGRIGPDFDGALYFDRARKLLLRIRADSFVAWLADALAMNKAERDFSADSKRG